MCNTVFLHSLPAQKVVSAKSREPCNICMLMTPFLLQYLSMCIEQDVARRAFH